MKTIEEIKKFFPNHKFEDDFVLKYTGLNTSNIDEFL